MQVLGNGGSMDTLIAGLDWVAQNWDKVDPPIRAVSISLGCPCNISSLHDAVRTVAQNVVVVVAAGNENDNLYNYSPAMYPEVITVTAMDASTNEEASEFSNWASAEDKAKAETHVVSAPGVSVYSTVLNANWDDYSGTSFAAPHVSGMVARCFGYTYRCKDTGELKLAEGLCSSLGTDGIKIKEAIISAITSKAMNAGSQFRCDPLSDSCPTMNYYDYLAMAPYLDADGGGPQS
ncbi:peptidase S8/S53 domain-containing protein [Dunaliella salina]|uniref:Peptidase S8/S53 domain-containing protein n=1 Tax=Dunaliella salina TaxID=3046 RepID=A0ABQ7H5D2_DUNSA|nr:peptidase S8/S53 domain-containing protein [Dunaliella salina]|eukprot:KAF5842066.1 peptidase S8/S53 domain-containing protein [Dunaliella salina]